MNGAAGDKQEENLYQQRLSAVVSGCAGNLQIAEGKRPVVTDKVLIGQQVGEALFACKRITLFDHDVFVSPFLHRSRRIIAVFKRKNKSIFAQKLCMVQKIKKRFLCNIPLAAWGKHVHPSLDERRGEC